MNFVLESISEEDRDKIDWAQFPVHLRPLGYPLFINKPTKWVIDRDRNIIFWEIEHPSPDTQFYSFGFLYNNDLIVMNAILKYKKSPKVEHKRPDLYWDVFSVVIPDLLNSKRIMILGLIKNAFEIYGRFGLEGRAGSVFVTFR